MNRPNRALAALLLVLSLIACGAEPRVETPAAPPPPSVAGAEKPVTELYKAHAADQGPFFQTTRRDLVDQYFESTLAGLIWADAVAANGEVGALGFDPLYGSQDVDLKNFAVQPAQPDGSNARVVVTFDNFGKREQVTYSLTRAGEGWKITDIRYAEGPTLREIYRANAATGSA